MSDAQPTLTDAAIDTAIDEFIAAIETLADHAPVRSALRASAIYKLIHRVVETTPDKDLVTRYVEDAGAELRVDIEGGGFEWNGEAALMPDTRCTLPKTAGGYDEFDQSA